MKRRTVILGGLAAAAAGAVAARPPVQGGPHGAYFAALNDALKRDGQGRPVIVLDRSRLRANVERVRARLPSGQALRVVVKSLPSLPLLREVMEPLSTQR